MKIHTCYKSFGKASTPPYPAFKVLKIPQLFKSTAYDVYSYGTIINGKHQHHVEYVRQNEEIDIQSVAKEGFKKWLHSN